VFLAGCPARPAGDWVVQQVRHLAWRLLEGELSAKFLLRNRDAKFTAAFDEAFRSVAVRVIGGLSRAPRANAFAEDGSARCGESCSTTASSSASGTWRSFSASSLATTTGPDHIRASGS